MTLDEAINRYTSNAFYEKSDSNLQGCLEFEQLAEWLKELKQLREQTRWTPVSERLPKEDNEVLITIKSCGKWYVCHSVYRDGLFWQKNFEFNSYRNPIAWMPLPEPCKEEGD